MSDDEHPILICARVSAMTGGAVGSVKRLCSRCMATVWQSPASFAQASAHGAPVIVCMQCAPDVIAASRDVHFEAPSAAVLEEVAVAIRKDVQ